MYELTFSIRQAITKHLTEIEKTFVFQRELKSFCNYFESLTESKKIELINRSLSLGIYSNFLFKVENECNEKAFQILLANFKDYSCDQFQQGEYIKVNFTTQEYCTIYDLNLEAYEVFITAFVFETNLNDEYLSICFSSIFSMIHDEVKKGNFQ